MAAWMMGQIEITDRKKYRPYAEQFVPILEKYGGTLMCLGDSVDCIEGQWPYPRTVILKFKDKAAALAWYHSPEYQALVEIRKSCARANIALVENLLDLPAR